MEDHGSRPVVFRFYHPIDREQIEHFRCAWRPWERDAQTVIRDAPSLIESDGIELIVAEFEDKIVGRRI